jgi:gliding motility-associated-like protein
MKKLILSLALVLFGFQLNAQGNTCANADPFCTGNNYTFPAGVNQTAASVAEPGNNYNCLGTSPNPAWYFMEIDQPGNLTINMTNSSNVDIDFILYGPYPNYTSAMSYCGNMGTAGSGAPLNGVVDCSYSTAANETAVINNAQNGEVYVLLITNFSNQNTNISFTNSANSTATTNCNIVNPCTITNLTANIGPCDIATGNYEITGSVSFVDPPTVGQLIITNCTGSQTVINAPFVSPLNYTISNIPAAGTPNCTVTATFTDDPSCTLATNPFTEPACVCNINLLQANIGLCDVNTNTFSINGTVEFTFPPAAGQLIITDCNGNQTSFNAPFNSPQAYTINNIPADGTTNCFITASFTANPNCSLTTNTYDNPNNCVCPAFAGTYTVNMNGQGQNNYMLCANDQITFTTNNNFSYPADEGVINGSAYDPGIAWLLYSCPPTNGVHPMADPCFLGVFDANTNGNTNDVNDGSLMAAISGLVNNQTVYFVPFTLYNLPNLTYNLDCWHLGSPVQVTYLNPVITNVVDDCLAGTVSVTVSGGEPSVLGGNFTGFNLMPPTANLTSNTVANGGTFVINNLQGGDNYSLSITDANGCQTTITGGPFGAPPNANAGPDVTICEGQSANLSASGGVTYSWSPAAGLSNPNIANPVASPTETTTYTVTVTSTCGTNSDDMTVTVNPLPIVDFSADELNGCSPVSTTFTNNNPMAGSTCLWDFGDGFASQNCGPVAHTYTSPGCYNVSLTVTAGGCSSTETIASYICVFANPVANFVHGPQPADVMNPVVNFVNLSSANATTLNWEFGFAANPASSNSSNPTVVYPSTNPGTYQACLEVITADGCQDIICKPVVINDVVLVYVPNAFTPDGDGVNDLFIPVLSGVDATQYEFYVFNRWGDIVFQTDSPNKGWDGFHKGIRAKEDVYVWRIKFRDNILGEVYERTGHVTLFGWE